MSKKITLKPKSAVKSEPKTVGKPKNRSLEIEKKFIVTNPEETLDLLKQKFGESTTDVKAGFWFCSKISEFEPILNISKTLFSKADTETVKSITEGAFPVEDYDFLRLRIKNKKKYILTFKQKSLVDNIEKNVEYEFEIDKETVGRVLSHLQEKCLLFYYNIKTTKLFRKDDVSIEYSTFNDLSSPYIEVEVTGNDESALTSRLQNVLDDFAVGSIREEPTSYFALSQRENKQQLRNVTAAQYSAKALNELKKML